MFGSQTWSSSGRYFLNFPVPERYAYLSGAWKMEMAKPKVEGTPTVGSISKKWGLYPRGFSCVNSPTSCTWRKVVDGYKRNIVSLPKHHIRISRVFATLIRPIVRNTECDPFFFCSTPPPPNGWPPSLARCGAPTHLRLLPCFLFTHVVSIVSLVPGHLSSRSLSF